MFVYSPPSHQILAADPTLYPVLANQTRAISLLLGLLAHENTDISLSVIDLLNELLEVNGLTEAGPERVNPLLDLLFNGQLIQLLMQNISRLDETKKDEADGVHKTLGENSFVSLLSRIAFSICESLLYGEFVCTRKCF
ncbi:hypothetical protein P879_11998 [Paragonimus westermani]|uniref:Beta-catenin-like protein 1 N-terminal domain-containing protein n=1 Tax=Paragonimus westermani TaxID=34504 RepID=A0A8T0D7N7_9TREM|nr:hypothetical protein P879_11998 [Paragonimus westermani]